MESTIISLIIFVTLNGCSATFPMHYATFGFQRPQAPPHFFYHTPQRQFPQQTLFQNFEPVRFTQPQGFGQHQNLGQPQIYIQPQTFGPSQGYPHYSQNWAHSPNYLPTQNYPYTLYNVPPPVPRDPYPGQFIEPYEPAVQYPRRHPPLQPFAVRMGKPPAVAGPVLKDFTVDCEKSEKPRPVPEEIGATVPTEKRTLLEQTKGTATDSIIEERLSESASLGATSTVTPSTNLEIPDDANREVSANSERRVSSVESSSPRDTVSEADTVKSAKGETEAATTKFEAALEVVDQTEMKKSDPKTEPTTAKHTNCETESPSLALKTLGLENSEKSEETPREATTEAESNVASLESAILQDGISEPASLKAKGVLPETATESLGESSTASSNEKEAVVRSS